MTWFNQLLNKHSFKIIFKRIAKKYSQQHKEMLNKQLLKLTCKRIFPKLILSVQFAFIYMNNHTIKVYF